jgi:hypothetical protein
MDGSNLVRTKPRPIRRSTKKPRYKTFRGSTHVLTANLAGYTVPVFKRKDPFDGDSVGMFQPETHEIAVQLPGQSPVAEADRLWHEFLHAISTIILPPEKRLDETQVNAISTAQIDLLQRNPSLLAFLLSRLLPDSEPDPLSASCDLVEGVQSPSTENAKSK